jgi:hypothetical protein
MLTSGKGRPITAIGAKRYLSKPLFFIREYETQTYANKIGFKKACCGCPACRYPSRRDIVEETLLHFFRGNLWEFDVPGMREFIAGNGSNAEFASLRSASAPGLVTKRDHLPNDFVEFAVELISRHLSLTAFSDVSSQIDFTSCLDDLGLAALDGKKPIIAPLTIPVPGMLVGRPLSGPIARAIAALGPFWAAFSLPPQTRRLALTLQRALFGISVDESLTNVTLLLRDYYGETQNA